MFGMRQSAPLDRFRIVCTGLLIERGHVLLVQEAKAIAKGLYNLPAGKLEPHETIQSGVKREVWEETGLRVRLVKLIGIYERVIGKQGNHLVNFVFLVKRVSGRLRPSAEHPDVRFFSLQEIPRLQRRGLLRTLPIRAAIADWRRGQSTSTRFVKQLLP